MTFRAGVNAFADPATGEVHHWARNHSEEQSGALVRNIQNDQPLAGRFRPVRALRLQAERDEVVYKLGGKSPTLAQHKMFLFFQDLSQRQTIYFHHCAGEVFECLLSDYEPQRRYLVRGPGGEQYAWPYSMQITTILLLP